MWTSWAANRRRVLMVLLASSGLLLACKAVALSSVTLLDNEKTLDIPIDTIGSVLPRHHFELYDPYQGREVDMQGVVFRDFLSLHFDEIPPALRFTAWDDYQVTLSGWDDPGWYLVTHEEGLPISVRERGPLRLVERDYGDRDTENLREFNDWIWMIRSIEAVW